MNPYVPNPLDTSHIRLPQALEPLLERLAENTHEVWAKRRMKDGWTFGPFRDAAAKTHPCLLPYASLPESEKEYDRSTASETLKAILLMGFEIGPPE
jgi:RyR domain